MLFRSRFPSGDRRFFRSSTSPEPDRSLREALRLPRPIDANKPEQGETGTNDVERERQHDADSASSRSAVGCGGGQGAQPDSQRTTESRESGREREGPPAISDSRSGGRSIRGSPFDETSHRENSETAAKFSIVGKGVFLKW